MIAAQIAGRSADGRTPEVLLCGCAVAVPSLPGAAATVATMLSFIRATPRVHW